MPYKMNAQSFARMRNQQSVHKRARMQDGGRTKSAQGRADPNDRNSTPRYIFARSTSGVLFFWCGGRENPQLAGKAWMPYKMDAQSFARMRNQQSVHKRAKDARWRSPKVVMQGCIKAATQSRYARMHKDSHTKPLHDATAQMAVDAQMQRHKWLSAQGRADPNDRKRKDA